MVRYEDPPGRIKHIRLGKISPEIYTALVGVPGVKSIVQHAGGSKGGSYKEHPHYHVWYESERAQTNQTIRNILKKLPEFATFSGQNDWSFRNHDSFEIWCQYVIKNPSYQVLLTHPTLQTIILTQKPPVVVLKTDKIEHITHDEAVHAEVAVIKQRASRAERWKLKEFLKDTWQWEENAQFTDTDMTRARNECKAQIIKWYSGWLDDRDGIRMLRFLMYTFGTDALRDELTFKISRNWDNYV